MDPVALDDLDTIVPDSYPQVRSVLVVLHGYLVYERYWQGVDAGDGQSSFSVTRSFLSALVGIARGDGHLRSLDQTVEELLAPHLPPDADPRLRRVTVAQLLAMTSGLAGDDSSLRGDDRIWDRMLESRDWVRHILGRRPETTPGESFAYSGANSHLLSAIVADTTGQSILAYARAKLFRPLGIDTDNALEQVLRRWPPTRAQVVPADYVAASIRPQSDPSRGPGDYGYHWWVTNETGHDNFRAMGFGGQLIQVIPDLDLVGATIVPAVTSERSRRLVRRRCCRVPAAPRPIHARPAGQRVCTSITRPART